MEIQNKELHRITSTAIIYKDGKYLITRRALNKKAFPGKWTVPGGGLEVDDYIDLPKNSEGLWYNAIDKSLRREIKEEVNLEVGTLHLKDLFESKVFDHPKPEETLKRIIEMSTKEGDIVLDFFAGSGTTGAVAMKMKRQFILVEQMDYVEKITVERLKKVIGKKIKKSGKMFEELDFDNGGISKNVNWKGGGKFIYCELMKYNEQFVEKIQKADTTKKLLNIWEDMKEKSFLNYNVDIKKFDASLDEFKKFPLAKQKRVLFDFLNKNQLYVNLSEIEDREFRVGEGDKKMNRGFYE